MKNYVPRLQKKFNKEIAPQMMKRFGYGNIMQVPRLKKISLNMGVGEAIQDPKTLDNAMKDLSIITGQKPYHRTAKKSISNFKLRQGMKIGAAVTLRGVRMYEFLDRFINLAIPRIRDFRGLSDKSFDGRGNYSIGVQEQIIFSEINVDKIDKIRGMNITLVTDAQNDEEAFELLKAFGMPFRQ
ncbi:MAG: 50S ribosomal protein L5 [Calditrichaeota bacterium]|nr:50S ribosomal protein L5 [Calditrichota bacterium]RQV92361.1 MAG: 50S ribosomal protein L5 [bacterium]RQV98704.1 MAG: 50S ribosomal protein L5 [Calditrichota bacterium]